MKTSIVSVALMLLAGSLGGCGLFGTREEPQVKMREALEVPPDLARPQGGDRAVGAPGGTAVYSDYAGNRVREPDQASRAGGSEPAVPSGVRLERDGGLRWLVVQDSPTNVLARIRKFLQGKQLVLEVDNPKAGIFETEWTERRINIGTNALTRMLSGNRSTGLRDKYRFRVEAGRVAGTSEVTVSQLGLEEMTLRDYSGGAEVGWKPRPTDPQAEAKMLADLMVALGASAEQAGTQVAAAAAERARKEQGGLLLPQEDFDRAWRRVGQALDRSAYVVEDRDRSAGVLYVYDRSAAKGSGTSAFGGWLRVGEGTEAEEDRFQVVLKQADAGVTVRVLNVKGERVSTKSGERLFDYLFSQLQ